MFVKILYHPLITLGFDPLSALLEVALKYIIKTINPIKLINIK